MTLGENVGANINLKGTDPILKVLVYMNDNLQKLFASQTQIIVCLWGVLMCSQEATTISMR
jgi:hypothetical protein